MDDRIARSRAQEKRVAKRHGGTRNAGSGNGWTRKADVRSSIGSLDFLWEMKRTDAKSISLKHSDLETVRSQAWSEGRMPILHLELCGRQYVVLEEPDFETLLEPHRE